MIKKLSPILLCCAVLLSSCVTVVSNDPYYARPVVYGPSIGLGTIIAVIISWTRNKSIFWAIIHGIFGWLYVIYAILVPKKSRL